MYGQGLPGGGKNNNMEVRYLEKIIISDHCKRRYAQRICKKTDQKEIERFITLHEDKIQKDVESMIKYGKKIYEGKNFSLSKKSNVIVILNGTWIIIIDQSTNVVITTYKIDLGLGEAFNKDYVNKFLNIIQELDEQYSSNEESLKDEEDSIKKEINECVHKISEYEAEVAEYNAKIIESREFIQKFENRKHELEISKESLDVFLAEIDAKKRDMIRKMLGRNVC